MLTTLPVWAALGTSGPQAGDAGRGGRAESFGGGQEQPAVG